MFTAIFGDNTCETWTPVYVGSFGITTRGNPSGKNGYFYYMSTKPNGSFGFVDIDTMTHHKDKDVLDYFKDIQGPNIFYGNRWVIDKAVEKYKQQPTTFSENMRNYFVMLGSKESVDWYNRYIEQYNKTQDRRKYDAYYDSLDYLTYRCTHR